MRLPTRYALLRDNARAETTVLSISIMMMSVVVSSTLLPAANAQVRIRERVEIAPMFAAPDSPGDSSWAMPQSGRIKIEQNWGLCPYEKTIVTSPASLEICLAGCGGNCEQWLQGVFPANSIVQLHLRLYDGYPYQQDIYPDGIVIDPSGLVADFTFSTYPARNTRVTLVPEPCEGEPCPNQSGQPQSFDVSAIERYREGDLFYPHEGSPPISVSGCGYLRGNKNRQGVTFIMPTVPLGSHGVNTWAPIENVELTACFDQYQRRWFFGVENLRIPVFSSSCITGLTDLGDGCDAGLLTNQITNRETYDIVLRDLKWWSIGPYSQLSSVPEGLSNTNSA